MPPLYVLIVRVAPSTFTRTVAVAGMRANRMPCWPPPLPTRSASTLNTWSAEVPSPVKTVSKPLLTTVPVAGRGCPPTRA